MGADTEISWATHTHNPWRGCTKVSSGCLNCYAEARDKRFEGGAHWGPYNPRIRATPDYLRQPYRWEAAAERVGTRPRVFCASLADVLDHQAPIEWRDDLWKTIWLTPHLDWLLLTKRPENLAATLKRLHAKRGVAWAGPDHPNGWPNVWLGTSVEDQPNADHRIPLLQGVPATVRFLSIEPLLGPIDLDQAVRRDLGPIHWVIVGGESGPGARPMEWAWVRDIFAWCRRNGVAFHMKQAGRLQATPGDAKGTRWESIPPDLQYREFPGVVVHA